MSTDDRMLRQRADEFVLGLLEEAEAAAVEWQMEGDAELRAAVAASRDRFVELDLAGKTSAVSPDLWPRLVAALGREAEPARASVDGGRDLGANDNRLSRWRAGALAGLAASLLLAAGLGYSLLNRPQPSVIAILVNDAGEPLVLVEDFGNDTARITPIGDFDVPAGRAMQVWTLPSKEMGPQSLGLLDGWSTAVLAGAPLPAPHEEQLYEITLEQPGGSPTGRPTGPILVKGFAKTPR